MNNRLTYLLNNKFPLSLFNLRDSDELFLRKLYNHTVYGNQLVLVKKLLADFPIDNSPQIQNTVFNCLFNSHSKSGMNMLNLFEPSIKARLEQMEDMIEVKSLFSNMSKKSSPSSQKIYLYAYEVLSKKHDKKRLDFLLFQYAPFAWVKKMHSLNCIINVSYTYNDKTFELKEDLFIEACANRLPNDRQEYLFKTYSEQIEEKSWKHYLTIAIEHNNFKMLDFLLNQNECHKSLENYYTDRDNRHKIESHKVYLNLFYFLKSSQYQYPYLKEVANYADMFIHLLNKHEIKQKVALDDYLVKLIVDIHNKPENWKEIEKIYHSDLLAQDEREVLIHKICQTHSSKPEVMSKSMDVLNSQQENALVYLEYMKDWMSPASESFCVMIKKLHIDKIAQFVAKEEEDLSGTEMEKVFQQILLTHNFQQSHAHQQMKRKMKI